MKMQEKFNVLAVPVVEEHLIISTPLEWGNLIRAIIAAALEKSRAQDATKEEHIFKGRACSQRQLGYYNPGSGQNCFKRKEFFNFICSDPAILFFEGWHKH